MTEWIKGPGFYLVQPTEPPMTKEEYRAYMAPLYAKLEAAKLKQKEMTA